MKYMLLPALFFVMGCAETEYTVQKPGSVPVTDCESSYQDGYRAGQAALLSLEYGIQYNDKVRVVSGFYRDSKGTVLGSDGTLYSVALKIKNETIQVSLRGYELEVLE